MGILFVVFDDFYTFGQAKIKQQTRKPLRCSNFCQKTTPYQRDEKSKSCVFALINFTKTSEILSSCWLSKCRRNFWRQVRGFGHFRMDFWVPKFPARLSFRDSAAYRAILIRYKCLARSSTASPVCIPKFLLLNFPSTCQILPLCNCWNSCERWECEHLCYTHL